MSVIKQQFDELQKMQKYVEENAGLLDAAKEQELKAYIDDQLRQCELYMELTDLVEKKKKESAAVKVSTDAAVKVAKEKPKRKPAAKKKSEEVKPTEAKTVEPVKEEPALFDDLDDLLG